MDENALLLAAPLPDAARDKKFTIEYLSDKILRSLDSANGHLKKACGRLTQGQRVDQRTLSDLLLASTQISEQVRSLLVANAVPAGVFERADQPAAPAPPINKEGPRTEARRQPRGAAAEPAAPPVAAEPPLAMYTPEPVPEREVQDPLPQQVPPVTDLDVLAVAGASAARGEPAQHGVFGIRYSKPFGYLAHNLNEPTAMAAFGAPGAGKSYFIYGNFEARLKRVVGINSSLAQEACGVIPRIGDGPDIDLEFLASVHPNRHGAELAALTTFYQAEPAGIPDQVIWCLPEDLAAYRARYPYVVVLPLQFSLARLPTSSFSRILGFSTGKQPLYMRELSHHLRAFKSTGRASMGALRDLVQRMDVSDQVRKLARSRLDLIEPYVRDDVDARAVLVRPGRAINLAISTDTISRDQGMLLGTIALDLLALRSTNQDCPLVILFDEAHEHFASPEMAALITQLVKRRRHIGTSTLFATHDPRCFRDGILAILDAVAQFATDDKQALKVLAEELGVFGILKPEDVALMAEGHGWFWARSYFNAPGSPDHLDGNQLQPLMTRPRFCHHGGATKRAVR